MMIRRWFPIFTLLLILSGAAAAEEPSSPAVPELPGLVGFDLRAAFETFGVPAEVFPHRGAEGWQDDVVFYYDRHLYLFWYQNRVWQVRLDGRYEGTFLSLEMGLPREEVIARLSRFLPDGTRSDGLPLGRFLPDGTRSDPSPAEVDGSLLFDLVDRDHPLRLRLVFEEDRLSDIYCYRSDF